VRARSREPHAAGPADPAARSRDHARPLQLTHLHLLPRLPFSDPSRPPRGGITAVVAAGASPSARAPSRGPHHPRSPTLNLAAPTFCDGTRRSAATRAASPVTARRGARALDRHGCPRSPPPFVVVATIPTQEERCSTCC